LASLHVIDGGLSTELERLGAKIQGELWTGRALLEDPDLVRQAHRAFALAGAEVVISSSYQLSRQGFLEVGLTEAEADEALRRSISVAREAVAGTNAKVAASIGPYGAVLHDGSEYRGDYQVSQAELEAFHAERLEVLLLESPDYLAIETIPNLVEARALAQVLKNVDVPKWFSFTAGSAELLWSGEKITDAVAAIAGLPNLVAVGVNCVNPEFVADIAERIKSLTDVEIIAYPNRGGTWDSANGVWLGNKPREFASWLPEWQAAGVTWVGGCCGTDSVDISTLSAAVGS
jgi:S-methylmethionine-dependent homocysteine/selenocysteine methylase